MSFLLCLKKWMAPSDSLGGADRVRPMSSIMCGWIHYLFRKGGDCILISLLLLMIGCATTAPQPETQNVEKIRPVSVSEFTLGPGDVIDVYVWRHDDLNQKVQVDPYGKIHYPFIGEIDVTGKSVSLVRDSIVKGLSKYYVNPVVKVSVISIQSQKVIVLGEVSNPGIFSIDGPMSVLDAITHSGGFTRDAKKENVLVIRGEKSAPQLIEIDLESAIEKGDLQQNVALQKGDIVYVPATFIADVSRFFRHLENIIRPIVLLENAIILGPDVWDVLQGEPVGERRTIVIERPD